MMMCPFFGRCGGCKYDFAAADYRLKKNALLHNVPVTDGPVWLDAGNRRRVDFCFAGGVFGLYAHSSKDIIPINSCMNAVPEINNILPMLVALPWVGAGACLVTLCDNGLDVAISSNVAYYTPEFKRAADALPAIRVTWNGNVLKQTEKPIIKFGDVPVEYPPLAFLQPGKPGEDVLRGMVVDAASKSHRVVDLFCGLGNFTYALTADGFDISGTGVKRDLFKNPITLGMLKKYDCVVMDPPRAGALAQCKVLAKSDVRRIVYVSCNPATFLRDAKILQSGGYKITTLRAVDQFVGSAHWELFSIFDK